MGEPELARRRAVLLVGSGVQLEGDSNAGSVFFQALHVSRPGTLDTSLVSTDNINNPRTMNAVYYLGSRMAQARKWGRETIAGGGLRNKQFNDYVPATDPLAQFFEAPSTTWTPRVLEGRVRFGRRPRCAQPRLHQYRRVQRGVAPAFPPAARRHADLADSARDGANELRLLARHGNADAVHGALPPRRRRSALPERRAGGGPRYLSTDAATLDRGKVVFAERCARCHSTKLPDLPAGLDLENANGPNYLTAWNAYWEWTKTEAFKAPMRQMVQSADFLDGNFLSTELRVPITLLGINACSPLATNAIRNNIWDNFSSESYKTLPSAGTIKIRNPVTGKEVDYPLPAGGRGLHSARVAREPLVDRAVSAEQHRGPL